MIELRLDELAVLGAVPAQVAVVVGVFDVLADLIDFDTKHSKEVAGLDL